ncbi:CoA-disulfide reductase [Endozoicomonas montiporae]|uniref:CoA-disulfide reductase n=2 Tax=Endozoicomonas montiporae TaxID=1027273 RepID=A0A081N6W7_9GAMM|nr:FAD-dependent oxidoreductase [Endozoicomonas montiporae]AMO56537.1 coenzyme A disulfide reductase [Endozoicomonas montiporae CL-33]KEQ14190.1 CoA-disulfide reductase [Endozoicomonas montiporae]
MKIVIIGGVAGGASAAAKARRLSEDAEIILFERGEQISFANCGLPYHIGGDIQDRDALLIQTPEKMHHRFNIDVRVETEITDINPAKKTVVAKHTLTGEEYEETYDRLILSPGAAPFIPPIEGIESPEVMTLRNMSDMDRILATLDNTHTRRAAVIGGGFIGLEMAEALVHRNLSVSLIEQAPQVMAPLDAEMAEPLHDTLRQQNVDLRLNTGVKRFTLEDRGITLTLMDDSLLKVDLVILAIGVRPETTLATSAGLEIGKTGGIAVNRRMETSEQDIFAVGDAVEINEFVSGDPALIPLAGPANRQGRIAAINALGGKAEYRGSQGTAVCKLFDLTVASTGLNEKALKRQGTAYEKVYIHANNHAGYYPGASKINFKLLFSSEGKVLGAQATGLSGVDKRIDVIATAIQADLSVYDLEEVELTYAPPYGSAKDVVNYAGFVAANVLNKSMTQLYSENLPDALEDPQAILLDVRNPDEITQSGAIPGSINIPLDSLRQNLQQLPKNKTIIVYCAVGLRGYLACRVLGQNGYNTRNLAGGYYMWQQSKHCRPVSNTERKVA